MSVKVTKSGHRRFTWANATSALAIFLSAALIAWWLYASTHYVRFPGHKHDNAIAFNIVLIIIVVISWVVAISCIEAENERRKRDD